LSNGKYGSWDFCLQSLRNQHKLFAN